MNYLYETHMHTFESSYCANLTATAVEQVRVYKKMGYTGVIVTDHLRSLNFALSRFLRFKALVSWKEKVKFLARGYENAKKEGDKVGLDVFFGWEFYYRGSDFLTYGLDIEFLLEHKNIVGMTIEAYSELVRKNGGYLAQAHPYCKLRIGERETPVEPCLLDGIEVYNARRAKKTTENEKAMRFARRHDLPMQAGTDSHHRLNYGSFSGIEMDKKAESIFDIIDTIKTRKARLVLTDGYFAHLDQEQTLAD